MNAPPLLSPRQRQALHEMGIDVWVRRVAAPQRRAVEAAQPEDAPVVAAASQQPTSAATASTDVALDCCTAAGVVAIGAFADAADARFAQDVVMALAGSAAPARRSAFKWPQTQTGDRSRSAAQQAYLGFISGQTERAGARCVLLFGPAAATLLPAQSGESDYVVLRFDTIAALRRDPAAKRALWLSIRRFAQR